MSGNGRDRRKARRMLEVIGNGGGSSYPPASPANGIPATGETPVQPSERRPPWNPDITLLTITQPVKPIGEASGNEPDAPSPKPFKDGAWGKGPFTIRTFQF